MDCIWIFLVVWKWTFFARFSFWGSRCMSDAITSTKLEETENISRQPMLFECMGICVFSPAHESKVRGYLLYVLNVINLLHWFCLNSATVYQIGRSYRGNFWGFFETFLEGSVDHIIYRNYILNRRFFFTYCCLACKPRKAQTASLGWNQYWFGRKDQRSCTWPVVQ